MHPAWPTTPSPQVLNVLNPDPVVAPAPVVVLVRVVAPVQVAPRAVVPVPVVLVPVVVPVQVAPRVVVPVGAPELVLLRNARVADVARRRR